MSTERGAALVRKWAQRFGLAHLRITVFEMSAEMSKKSLALSYYDLDEEWAYIWLPADSEYEDSPTTLELLVLHELAHGVLWNRKDLERACDRIARLATGDFNTPWPGELQARRDPQSFFAERKPQSFERREWLPIVTDALPEQERDVINRLYFEGQSLREVADEMGVHQRTVGRWRDDALRRLSLYFDALDRKFGGQ